MGSIPFPSYMNAWRDWYEQGGPVRVGLLSLKSLLSVLLVCVDAITREHRFSQTYPLPLEHRLQAYRHGFLSSSYVHCELHKNNPKNYLSDYTQGRVVRPAVTPSYHGVFKNKAAFHLSTRKYTNRIPELFGTIRSGYFSPALWEERSSLFELIQDEEEVIVKPVADTGGTGVRKISWTGDSYRVNEQSVSKTDLNTLFKEFDNYIITEFVHQHQYAATIAPGSVNSIRIVTVKDVETDETFVPVAVHRFGSNDGSPTDNWHSNGFAAPINVSTGQFMKLRRYSKETGMEYFDTHPESGIKITGLRVPQWNIVKDLAVELAEIHKQNPYVGWDIVLTDDGPIVLEGNAAPHSEFIQMGHGLFEDDRVREAFHKF